MHTTPARQSHTESIDPRGKSEGVTRNSNQGPVDAHAIPTASESLAQEALVPVGRGVAESVEPCTKTCRRQCCSRSDW